MPFFIYSVKSGLNFFDHFFSKNRVKIRSVFDVKYHLIFGRKFVEQAFAQKFF